MEIGSGLNLDGLRNKGVFLTQFISNAALNLTLNKK